MFNCQMLFFSFLVSLVEVGKAAANAGFDTSATLTSTSAPLTSTKLSPYGIILIPGMAKRIERNQAGFDVFTVHVKGRISSPIQNEVMQRVVNETGFVLAPEFDDESANSDVRMTYFFTTASAAGENVSFSFFQGKNPDFASSPLGRLSNDFRSVPVMAASASTTTNALVEADGDFSAMVNIQVPWNSSKSNIGESIFYNVTGVPVMNYAMLALDEGFCVVADIDDTIRVSGVAWLPTLFQLSFKKKFIAAPTMPEYFAAIQSGLTVPLSSGEPSPPTYHYLSGSPQQFMPVVQAWVQKHYPLGEFVFPPFARSDGLVFGLTKYKEFKINQSLKIIDFYPKRKLILFGDATQFDAEAYSEVYKQHPDSVQCIFIRLVEGFNVLTEPAKNDPYRFLRAFIGIPHSKWMVFRNATELPSAEEIQKGQCRDPNWFQQ